jgi:Flp pilus assembly protein TadG
MTKRFDSLQPAVHFAPTGLSRGSETGSVMVEFALTVILLFLMLFGIIDFSRALYTYHFVSNAARTATRWAMVNGADCNLDSTCNGTAPMNSGPASTTDVQNYVKGLTPPGIDPNQITTTACGVVGGGTCAASPPSCTISNGAGCTVKVTVSYNFGFLVPLVYKNGITLHSTSQMIIAH